MSALGCNNSGREQLVAALPAQLDAQGCDTQQAGQGKGTAEWVEQQGCQGVRAPVAAAADGVALASKGIAQIRVLRLGDTGINGG
ncbi:hypothetical protein HaLaN_22658 [Haematococcus lacustris]|uniref:Uncharacterized protein n=1 Tax=Haematococcus lacustris TaxID=44745 RepID=A0A699ZYM5_HAELA|nr:hypothetical protein HaLaN_22658 [Haematococcus lacustris]